ncbi:MAG: type II toxin-antitoxin system HicB family antitoxin [Candidatus Acidiferrales bacterium]
MSDSGFGTPVLMGYNPLMKNGKGRAYEYTAFFEANEHGGYTVTVPALPGLVTQGKDLSHARDMAKDAIRCYIEGLKKAKQAIPIETETAQLKLSVTA